MGARVRPDPFQVLHIPGAIAASDMAHIQAHIGRHHRRSDLNGYFSRQKQGACLLLEAGPFEVVPIRFADPQLVPIC